MNAKAFVLILIVLLLVSCDRISGRSDRGNVEESATRSAVTEGTEASATPHPTRPLQTGTTILVDGQLVAVNPTLPLSFMTSGRLLTLEVKTGDLVAAGDLIATLNDEALREAVTNAEMQLTQTENSLAQSQLSLDELLSWEPDEIAVTLAEANLVAAEAALETALAQDLASGNNLTSARISVQQAERGVADAQAAYETAFDPGREWEYHMVEPSCLPGQGGSIPCTGVPLHIQMKNEREGAERAVISTQDNLAIARANYNLAISNLNSKSALNAEAAVVSAQQALEQAQTGPKDSEIAAARLQVEQAELSLEQAQFSLDQALGALDDAVLFAPWQGTVLSVDVAPGAIVGNGTPIITLMDTEHLEFHTSNLSERDLAQIEPGQQVQLTLKTYPGQSITGIVSRIVPQASGNVGDAATFTVVVDLEETDLTLLTGMTGRAEIQRKG